MKVEEIKKYMLEKFIIKNNEVKKNDGTRKVWSDSDLLLELSTYSDNNDLEWSKKERLEGIESFKNHIKEEIAQKYDQSYDKTIFCEFIDEIYEHENWMFDFSKNSVVCKIPNSEDFRTVSLETINTAIETNMAAFRINTGNRTITSKDLLNYQSYAVDKKREKLLNEIIDSIKYEDTNFIDEYLKIFHKTLNLSQEYEIFKMIFLHWCWQIKRRILERSIINQLWVAIHGAQGTGKSTVMNKIFKPIFKNLYTNTLSLIDLTDPNQASVFTTQLVINVEELDNGSEGYLNTNKLAKLKKYMSNEDISYRKFFTQKTENTKINATLISTSNEHLYDKMNDETGLRRFFELNSLNAYQERFETSGVDWLSENGLRFFKNIDENNSRGYWIVESEIGKKITEIQNSYIKENSFITFLKESYILDETLKFEDCLTLKQIQEKYYNYCDENNIQERFRVSKNNMTTKISDLYVKDFQKIHANQKKYNLKNNDTNFLKEIGITISDEAPHASTGKFFKNLGGIQ